MVLLVVTVLLMKLATTLASAVSPAKRSRSASASFEAAIFRLLRVIFAFIYKGKASRFETRCAITIHAYAACAPGVSPCGGRYHMVMESSLIRHEDRYYTGIRMSQTLVL